MKDNLFQDIKILAKTDFSAVQNALKSKHHVTSSIENLRFESKDNCVTATCDFCFDTLKDEAIEASIQYNVDSNNIYADSSVNSLTQAIYGAIGGSVAITAADEDNDDMFTFDDDTPDDSSESFDEMSDDSDGIMLEDEEFEDPEDEPDIETDNNIAGHYIVECSRCHGVFISALMESDQQVEYLTGVCPLCEKESDQYIKWVVHPVEF